MSERIDMSAPPTIEIDLPCASCGYNLRGLGAQARCPECGTAATESLLELLSLARTGQGQRVSPSLLRQWGEGAIAVVAAGAVMLVIAIASYCMDDYDPSWRYAFSGKFRATMLSVACAAFALQLAGIWKLGSCGDDHNRDRVTGVLLRGLAALIVVYVLLMLPAVDPMHPLSLRMLGRWRGRLYPLLYVLGLTIPAMHAVLWLRIGSIARKQPSRWLSVVSAIIACSWPGAMAAAMLRGSPSLLWSEYTGSYEAGMWLPLTWLWIVPSFWPLRLGEYDRTCTTLLWLIITGLMVIGEIGLAVVSRRRLRELARADDGAEASARKSSTSSRP
jgi:hypothetical protein